MPPLWPLTARTRRSDEGKEQKSDWWKNRRYAMGKEDRWASRTEETRRKIRKDREEKGAGRVLNCCSVNSKNCFDLVHLATQLADV